MSNPIFEYIFPFGLSKLTLRTASKMNDKAIEEIDILINSFQNELNSKVINSSAHKFNNAQVGMPVYVKKEFVEFLELNIDYCRATLSAFNPFLEEIVDDLFIIDISSNAIIKQRKVKFNSNLLYKYFIVNKINQYIKEEVKPINYLIETRNIQSSFGKLRWKTQFDIEQVDSVIHFKLFNQSAILEPNVHSGKFKGSTKFAAFKEDTVIPDYFILIGKNACDLKVLSYELYKLQYKSEFKNFMRENDIDIIPIMKNKEIIEW